MSASDNSPNLSIGVAGSGREGGDLRRLASEIIDGPLSEVESCLRSEASFVATTSAVGAFSSKAPGGDVYLAAVP